MTTTTRKLYEPTKILVHLVVTVFSLSATADDFDDLQFYINAGLIHDAISTENEEQKDVSTVAEIGLSVKLFDLNFAVELGREYDLNNKGWIPTQPNRKIVSLKYVHSYKKNWNLNFGLTYHYDAKVQKCCSLYEESAALKPTLGYRTEVDYLIDSKHIITLRGTIISYQMKSGNNSGEDFGDLSGNSLSLLFKKVF